MGKSGESQEDGNKTRYKLEPDHQDSVPVQTVKRIFTMAMGGMGVKEIAKALNKEGLRTSTGSRWTRTYVHKVLNNEAYKLPVPSRWKEHDEFSVLPIDTFVELRGFEPTTSCV